MQPRWQPSCPFVLAEPACIEPKLFCSIDSQTVGNVNNSHLRLLTAKIQNRRQPISALQRSHHEQRNAIPSPEHPGRAIVRSMVRLVAFDSASDCRKEPDGAPSADHGLLRERSADTCQRCEKSE